jgi:predicted GIY-YIG superfamily endonuclease
MNSRWASRFEEFRDITRAINREKEIKGWPRTRKLALIEASNPTWLDLSGDWFENPLDSSLRSE